MIYARPAVWEAPPATVSKIHLIPQRLAVWVEPCAIHIKYDVMKLIYDDPNVDDAGGRAIVETHHGEI